ncbi:MAG: hypothetical protein KatS3mg131_2404 [Candidatus Tectimicrobiota bacterium]|nr:MAG: hypothetical protein KatS3mg131_2404 [Candidatus Tectomicrobia bacterium]
MSAAVEQAAAAHAQHIVAGDRAAVLQDCIPGVLQTPADLYERLLVARFERYAIVGHAKIGFQHVFKIRYFGPRVVTLHHRLGERDGRWWVLESEVVSENG